MSNKQKFFTGLASGFCLALVKMVDLGFLVGTSQEQLLGGILTAVGLMLLAAVPAAFLEEESSSKLFWRALVIPSVLIATVHRAEQSRVEPPPVPSIEAEDLALVRAALIPLPTDAGVLRFASSQIPVQAPPVQIVTEADLGRTLLSGAAKFLGREGPQRYWWTLGKTAREEQAIELVARLDTLAREIGVQLMVLHVEGSQEYYVMAGDSGSSDDVIQYRREALNSLDELLTQDSGRLSADVGPLLKYIRHGPIVSSNQIG